MEDSQNETVVVETTVLTLFSSPRCVGAQKPPGSLQEVEWKKQTTLSCFILFCFSYVCVVISNLWHLSVGDLIKTL